MKRGIFYTLLVLFSLIFICVVAFRQEKATKENDINENNIKEEPQEEQDTDEWLTGWTTNSIDVKVSPDMESDTLGVISFNTQLQYYKFNNEWACIEYIENQHSFIELKYISEFENVSTEYQVPSNRGFKSYMSYRAITSKSSPQYILQNQYAYVGEYGICQAEGRFCVAIGTFSNASIGTYIDLILENGVVIPCMVADFKADIDTDSTNMITKHNGCVSEFLVNIATLHSTAKKRGNISYCREEWKSPVRVIKVYEKNVFNGEE